MASVRKDGTPRKQLSYEHKTLQTAYLAQHASKLHGKTLNEIAKTLHGEFGVSFDLSTLRRQCQVFKIRYGRPRKADAKAAAGVSPAYVQELADMLTIIGDVLVIAIQASSLAPDERDKQTIRLIEVSDNLASVKQRLAAAGKVADSAEKPEQGPTA
jgi:hypothetical protein